MIRWIIRSLLFAYASIFAAQYIVGGFSYGSVEILGLLVLAIALLNMFIIPISKVLGLPHKGIGFIFISFVLTLVTVYILPMFLPSFKIVETTLSQLRIFGYVLPSKQLTVTWSAVYSALVVSLVYHFFEWLCGKR
jgi:uncharacterized membrane protein YvlD (DUF360 family)